MYEANVKIPNPSMGAPTTTQLHRIILANQPRLLREMLGRVFETTPGLEVVAVVENPIQLANITGREEAHWLIVTLGSENEAVMAYFTADNAPPSLLAISADGKQIEVQTTKPNGAQETYTLCDISLENLLAILR